MSQDLTPVSQNWSRRFGEHIQTARGRALLSRAQLAKRVGVAEETIRQWERGTAHPTPDRLTRLIVVLALDGAAFTSIPRTADDLPALAQKLREERLRRGITQAQAGRFFGVAQPTYAGWELGRAAPGPHVLGPLAEFLGCAAVEVRALAATEFVVDTAGWPPLGRAIGARRAALRMTREELARALSVTPATVTGWELGYRAPRPQRLQELARTLEINIEELAAAMPRRELQLSELGQLIRERQSRLGLRRRDIAERAGLDEATLSRWVHGRNAPELSSLKRLAAALEMPFPVVCRVAGLSL